MTKRLVIVESPTKAKTLGKFLGKDFVVESSVGHIRDLPAGAAEIPEEYKGEKWARLAVNIAEDFQPLYVINPDKKKVITDLKKKLKACDELLLATDEDREGEAISWHLLEVLKPKCTVKRMVFHEITKEAVEHALEDTRELDTHLVEAQEARRIIDRLYGYEISPLLWKKIKPKLSAGRVQSVAIRIIVERELERMRFQSAEYWDLAGIFATGKEEKFPAKLVSIDGLRLANGRDFDPDTGALKDPASADKIRHLKGEEARALVEKLRAGTFNVIKTEERPFTQRPPAPFTTSTLQQEAGRKLGFDARRTMRAAQRLYELGFITYMRTDSVNLSKEALNATRNAVIDLYGHEFLPKEPRIHKGKVKNAQEAHEAIRPSGETFLTPGEVSSKISLDESKVYELIWKRTMACQMLEARGRKMTVTIEGIADGTSFRFTATGRVIDFAGFLRAYVEGSDDPDAELADKDTILPAMAEGDTLAAKEITPEEHHTKPPARLTEASLVKLLEESGIGRPSTYASIIQTIQARDYTFKKGQALVPSFTAFAVVQLMKNHFSNLINLDFTAKMEDRLDTIARGEYEALPYLKEFYFGNGTMGLKGLLEQNLEAIDPRTVCSIPLPWEYEGATVTVRVGRYGPYLEAGEARANIADGVCPDELDQETTQELFRVAAEGPRSLGDHPESKLPIYVKVGRFGPYVQLGDRVEDSKEKPKMSSLLPGMTPETVTLDEAVQLLNLPRTVGQDPEGVDVVVAFGRYGAYVKRGTDTRSLTETDHVLTVGLERCLELLAQPRTRGRRAPAEPLKRFESVEALDGVELKVLKGRYGPYVTDGETNASLPRDYEDPTALTEPEAVQLILDRRARVGKKKTKKKTTKKKAKKKTTKKKTAKKKTTKKTTKKKTTKKKTSKKTAKKSSAKSGDAADSDSSMDEANA